MSFACFKVKQRNIFGLALIDTGNLVHSAIVSRVPADALSRSSHMLEAPPLFEDK